jgi:dipeptidyl-peptidase-3
MGTYPRPFFLGFSLLTIHLSLRFTAVKDYLQKIHIYKSTADFEAASAFYAEMCTPDVEFWGRRVRDVVVANIEPRKVFVQANTSVDEGTGEVILKHYDASLAGLVQSWAERGI